jgi:hypothetical protein
MLLRWRAKIEFSLNTRHAMDNEQINAIGTMLADLTHRTEQLRGYL